MLGASEWAGVADVRRCAVVRRTFRLFLAALLAVAVALSASCAGGGSVRSHATSRMSVGADGLATIAAAQLPLEARRTLRLIQQGGPFPYPRDGVTFQNREGMLPREPSGYYREYTVPTPGAGDRGARRIITGKNGERYYTPDHYRTFMIVQGA